MVQSSKSVVEIKNVLENRMGTIGRRSKRMANISATLPTQLLDRIDEMVDQDKVPSRSFVIREAVRNYVKELEQH
ncbi:MAG: ribbon-helix-helix domain-containing protein [Candidatus Bathyarchaeia archaeon]